jgi:glycerol-3-phosphate cytidylyltransferase
MIKGFTCSAFDLLHAGHVEMLRECKQYCDWLIVGLHVNPQFQRLVKNSPIQTTYERYVQLRGNAFVDEILPYETEQDLVNILAIEPISVRFVGEEYKGSRLTGHDVCEKRGIKIIYNKRSHSYSSSELRKRIIDGYV